jgi:prolyl oligopeptidase
MSSTTSSPPPNGWFAKKRTTTQQLAIWGESNGGLLVGAVEVQRPDLFGACIPMVGVMDMLRFQKFNGGHYWRSEFGNIEKQDEFKSLLAYSPYHNIKKGTFYPPTLVMTADTDDRVVPMNSFKFAAAMQRAQSCDSPILLRVETRAGHGGNTPLNKAIEGTADWMAFLVRELGMESSADVGRF